MRQKLRLSVCRTAGLKLLFALFLFLPGFTVVSAQTVIPPATIEKTFYSPVTNIGFYINNAVLDYTYLGTPGQLMAVVWDNGATGGGGTAGTIAISDGVAASPITYALRVPSGCIGCTVSTPDVTLGEVNIPGTPAFHAGVVYGVTDPNSGITDVYLDVFTITNPGDPLNFAVTPSCSDPFNISNGGGSVDVNEDEPPHIDIISKEVGGPLGPVLSDAFVVCWEQYSSSITPHDVYAMYYSGLLSIAGNCSGFTPPTPVNITNALSSGLYGGLADVAGIERTVAPGVVHDFALFTYIGSNSVSGGLYYQEWDVTTTPSTPVLVDIGLDRKFPRIDAVDCHTQNDPTNGYANYDIVYNYADPITFQGHIGQYNNIAGKQDCSSGYFVGAGNQFPVVACGPGMQYDITYYSQNTSAHTYSQLVDWSSGNLVPTNSTYLQVDSILGTYANTATGISSAVNNLIPDNVFVCWYNATLGEIDYKISPSPVVYRSTGVASVAPVTDWQLSPNPATDDMYLSASVDNVQGATYNITDITGRVLQQALVTTARQQIAVGSLLPGMYMLNVGSEGQHVKTIKFVKE